MEPNPNNKETFTLDVIDSFCREKYTLDAKRIIVIVLARYDLDAVKDIIRRNYNYWHELTGNNLDFFWLGYGMKQSPSDYRGDNTEDFITSLRFDNRSYVKDMERLERLSEYRFNDEIGLLLCDCYAGSVQYEKSLYLKMEALAYQSTDINLRKFFKLLIEACRKNECIEDVKTELITKRMYYNLGGIKITNLLGFARAGLGFVVSFLA